MTDIIRLDRSVQTVRLSLDLVASLVPGRTDPPIPVEDVTIGVVSMSDNAPHQGEMHPDVDDVLYFDERTNKGDLGNHSRSGTRYDVG